MRLVELRPALALSVVLAFAVPAAAFVTFQSTEEVVDSVDNPQAVTLADVNGDGVDDAIVVDSGFVSVWLNDGQGVLEEDGTYDAGDNPVAVATGLFNNDAFVDIVSVDLDTGTIFVLFNNGEGVFDDEDPRQVVVGADPRGVAVADFNNDQEPDLAVLSPSSIYLLQGNGDGTFSAFNPATISTQGTTAFTIAAALLDTGNTNMDLAVTNRSTGQVAVFLGNGDGTFEFNALAQSGPLASGFIIADVDQNETQDLVVADNGGEITTEMSLFLNDGSAFFDGVPDKFTGPEMPLAITGLDVEPDGKVDLAITSSEASDIFLLCQPSEVCNGDAGEAGLWRPAIGGTVRGCSDAPQVAIASGKLNGDDKDDFVVLKGEDDLIDSFCVVLNQSGTGPTPTRGMTPVAPTATPTGPTPTPTEPPSPTPTPTSTEIPTIGLGVCNTKDEPGAPSLGKPVALATGDFNQDGIRDVAVADSTGNRIVIVITQFGTPSSADPCMGLDLQPGAVIPVNGPEAIVSADLDRDGSADLAVIGIAGLSVFYGNGAGQFERSTANPISAGTDPSDVVLADFNGDLTPDLIVPDLASQSATIFMGTNPHQRNQPFNTCPMPVGRQTSTAVSTDLNSDGRNDFAVASPQTREIAVFLQVANAALDCGNMAASFRGQTTLTLPGEPTGLVAGTFVLTDTVPDLVVAMKQPSVNGSVLLFEGRQAEGGVSYIRGNPTGLPTPTPPSTSNLSVPSGIGTGELERDGRLDLLLTDFANNTLVEFRGQGGGGLGVPLIPAPVITPTTVGGSTRNAGPADLVVADLDRDGREDVIVANAEDGSLSYMLSAQRAFTPTPSPTTPAPPTNTRPPQGSPTSTPTETPTPTRSRAPTNTQSPAPTNTKHGVVTLSGNGCTMNDGTHDSGQMVLVAFALVGLVVRRFGRLWA